MRCLILGLALLTHAFENPRASGVRKPGKIITDDAEDLGSERNVGDVVHTFQIEHSITPGVWKPRSSVDLIHSTTNRAAVVKFAPATLSVEDLTTIKNLSPTYYSVRLVNNRTSSAVTASVQTCQLVTSGFRELFVFNIDGYGNLIGINYRTPVADCSSRATFPITAPITIQSKGKTLFGRNGETPKISKMQMQEKEAEGAEAPQSFLAKYWMYLIPLGLIVLSNLAGGAAPQEGGGK